MILPYYKKERVCFGFFLKRHISVPCSFEERLEDVWQSLLHHAVGVTVTCPPTSPQAVAALHYCHSAQKQTSALEDSRRRAYHASVKKLSQSKYSVSVAGQRSKHFTNFSGT